MDRILTILTQGEYIIRRVLEERNRERMLGITTTVGEMYTRTEAFAAAMIDDAQQVSAYLMEIIADALRLQGEEIPQSRSLVRSDIQQIVDRIIAEG
jgi:hypothetical protein